MIPGSKPLMMTFCPYCGHMSKTPNPWIKVSDRLPNEKGKYLCAIRFSCDEGFNLEILKFTHDLYSIDDMNFSDKKGVPGFYYFDEEYGYCHVEDVEYWMPLPMNPDEYEEKNK